MGKLIEQYELVKEIKCSFNDIEHAITGKIYRVIKGPRANFTWEIDHYCKLDNEAAAYTPSAPFGESIEEAERALMAYMERFEKDGVTVVPNTFR